MGDEAVAPCPCGARVAMGRVSAQLRRWLWGQGHGDGAVAVGTVPWWQGQAQCTPPQVALGSEPWPCVRAWQWGRAEGPGQRGRRCSHPSRMAARRGGSGCLSPGCAGAGGADSGGADLLGPAGRGVGPRRRPSCLAPRPPAGSRHPGFTGRTHRSWPQSRAPSAASPGSSWRGDSGVSLCRHKIPVLARQEPALSPACVAVAAVPGSLPLPRTEPWPGQPGARVLLALVAQGRHWGKVCPGNRVLGTRCHFGVPCTSPPPNPWVLGGYAVAGFRLPGQRSGHCHLCWLMVDGGAGTTVCRGGWGRCGAEGCRAPSAVLGGPKSPQLQKGFAWAAGMEPGAGPCPTPQELPVR